MRLGPNKDWFVVVLKLRIKISTDHQMYTKLPNCKWHGKQQNTKIYCSIQVIEGREA